MGATNGCVKSMLKMGDIYRDLNLKQKKEGGTYYKCYTEDMEKYYLMAIEKNNIEAMTSLGNFYMTMGYDETNKVKGEKYLLMAAHEKVKELIS
jgi:TPR repeat protein